ncbi:MAG: cytochrome b/b6 domain-containing protein [Halofilum sp. (in: g-proteobacteria)]|nr:cytochrome b/b6 domain-containing protein [Halofilum sp. (in: g-proteobacteria)]
MNGAEVKVWDPLVRIFHWSLVLLFTLAYVTGDDESTIHEWSGYAILMLVAARLVWGVIGSRHARFGDFVRSPRAAIVYLKGVFSGRAPRYLGHNPAAGWMVIALLISVTATGASGVVVLGLDGAGPLGGRVDAQSWMVSVPASMGVSEEESEDDDEHEEEEYAEGGYEARAADVRAGLEAAEEVWEEVHEFLANFTVLLIALHVLGVIVSSIGHRENLVRAMFTGRKRASGEFRRQ